MTVDRTSPAAPVKPHIITFTDGLPAGAQLLIYPRPWGVDLDIREAEHAQWEPARFFDVLVEVRDA